MGKNDEILWEAPPHTLAKIKIVENYLKAWTAILSHNNPLLIIDGFAGPGRYKGGEEGSPIASIKVVLEHSLEFKHPVKFIFIEKVSKLNKYLEQEVEKLGEQITNSDRILGYPRIILGECESEIEKLIDEYKNKQGSFGPAFVFLDQFGYSKVSMDLVKMIMSFKKCEVFTFLNWNNLNRYITDNTKWRSISKAFGSNKWKQVFEEKDKALFIKNEYAKSLLSKAKVKYVCPFEMINRFNKIAYWLFFCTNNQKGLLEMQRAMSRISSRNYIFSDRDDQSQTSFLHELDVNSLKNQLTAVFKGKTVKNADVREYILDNGLPLNYASTLQEMLKNNEIEIINKSEKQSISFTKDLSLQIRFK